MTTPFRFSVSGNPANMDSGSSASFAHYILPKPKPPRPPIHNPYDKFTQPEFDAWIGGITGALRRALGQEDEPETQPSVPVSEARPFDEDRQKDISEAEDEHGGVDDSFAEVKARRVGKGKARDPREGPGLRPGEINQPIEIGSDSDSDVGERDEEEEVSGDEDAEDAEEWVEDGRSDSGQEDSWEQAESSTQARGRPERDFDDGDISYEEVEEDSAESRRQMIEDVIELSSEEDNIKDSRKEVVHQVDEDNSDEDEYDDEEIETSRLITGFPKADGYHGGLNLQESDLFSEDELNHNDDDFEQPLEDDTAFPPHSTSGTHLPVDLPDPWIGPRIYAEDFYSGGDIVSKDPGSLDADVLGEEDNGLLPTLDIFTHAKINDETVISGSMEKNHPESRSGESVKFIDHILAEHDDTALDSQEEEVSSPEELIASKTREEGDDLPGSSPILSSPMHRLQPLEPRDDYELDLDGLYDDMEVNGDEHDSDIDDQTVIHGDWDDPSALSHNATPSTLGNLMTADEEPNLSVDFLYGDDDHEDREEGIGAFALGTSDLDVGHDAQFGDDITDYIVSDEDTSLARSPVSDNIATSNRRVEVVSSDNLKETTELHEGVLSHAGVVFAEIAMAGGASLKDVDSPLADEVTATEFTFEEKPDSVEHPPVFEPETLTPHLEDIQRKQLHISDPTPKGDLQQVSIPSLYSDSLASSPRIPSEILSSHVSDQQSTSIDVGIISTPVSNKPNQGDTITEDMVGVDQIAELDPNVDIEVISIDLDEADSLGVEDKDYIVEEPSAEREESLVKGLGDHENLRVISVDPELVSTESTQIGSAEETQNTIVDMSKVEAAVGEVRPSPTASMKKLDHHEQQPKPPTIDDTLMVTETDENHPDMSSPLFSEQSHDPPPNESATASMNDPTYAAVEPVVDVHGPIALTLKSAAQSETSSALKEWDTLEVDSEKQVDHVQEPSSAEQSDIILPDGIPLPTSADPAVTDPTSQPHTPDAPILDPSVPSVLKVSATSTSPEPEVVGGATQLQLSQVESDTNGLFTPALAFASASATPEISPHIEEAIQSAQHETKPFHVQHDVADAPSKDKPSIISPKPMAVSAANSVDIFPDSSDAVTVEQTTVASQKASPSAGSETMLSPAPQPTPSFGISEALQPPLPPPSPSLLQRVASMYSNRVVMTRKPTDPILFADPYPYSLSTPIDFIDTSKDIQDELSEEDTELDNSMSSSSTLDKEVEDKETDTILSDLNADELENLELRYPSDSERESKRLLLDAKSPARQPLHGKDNADDDADADGVLDPDFYDPVAESHRTKSHIVAHTETDPFKLMGTDSVVAPGAVEDDTSSAESKEEPSSTKQSPISTSAKSPPLPAEISPVVDAHLQAIAEPSNEPIDITQTREHTPVTSLSNGNVAASSAASTERGRSADAKTETSPHRPIKRKRSEELSISSGFARSVSSKIPVKSSRLNKNQTVVKPNGSGKLNGKVPSKGKQKEHDHQQVSEKASGNSGDSASSSGASTASRMLHPGSRNTSRASSIASTAPSEKSSIVVQPSPTVTRLMNVNNQPAIHPPLFHAHGHARAASNHRHQPPPPPPAQQPIQRQIQKALPLIRSTDPLSMPPVPSQPIASSSQPLHRVVPSSSSPVTRSNCRYHKISLPKEEGGPRVCFLVPGCSLGDRELMDEEEIEDHGFATHEDSVRMVQDIETLDFDLYLIGILRQLVGVDILREQEVYYLPRPGEEIVRKVVPRKSVGDKSTISSRDVTTTFEAGSSAGSPRASISSVRSPIASRAPISAAGSTSTSVSAAMRKYKNSTQGSLSSISDTESEMTDEDELELPPTKRTKSTAAKAKAMTMGPPSSGPQTSTKLQGRNSIRRDASAYRPDADNSPDETKSRAPTRKGSKQGIKRTRTSDVTGGDDDTSSRKTKKIRTRLSGP